MRGGGGFCHHPPRSAPVLIRICNPGLFNLVFSSQFSLNQSGKVGARAPPRRVRGSPGALPASTGRCRSGSFRRAAKRNHIPLTVPVPIDPLEGKSKSVFICCPQKRKRHKSASPAVGVDRLRTGAASAGNRTTTELMALSLCSRWAGSPGTRRPLLTDATSLGPL